MNEKELMRIAELSALDISDARELEGELCYIAEVMGRIPKYNEELYGDELSVRHLRRDTAAADAPSGLLENAPRSAGGYILIDKMSGV